MFSLRWLSKLLNHNRTKQVYLTCSIILLLCKLSSSKPLLRMPSTSCSSSNLNRCPSNSNNRAICSVEWIWISLSSSNNLWCNKCHSKLKFNQIFRLSNNLRIVLHSWVVNSNSSSSNLCRTNSTSCNSHNSSSNSLCSNKCQCNKHRTMILGHSSRLVQRLSNSNSLWIYLED